MIISNINTHLLSVPYIDPPKIGFIAVPIHGISKIGVDSKFVSKCKVDSLVPLL